MHRISPFFAVSLAILLLSVSIPSASSSSASSSKVIELTDSDFEDRTQASTGSTSGIWLLEFYSPNCGHCKNFAPTYEAVANELYDQHINVAKIDAPRNPKTARRFDIKGYPTVKLLRNGKIYTYSGSRTRESVEEFVLEGYKTAKEEGVPRPLSFFESILDMGYQLFVDIANLLSYRTIPSLVIFGFGVLIGVVLSMLIYLVTGDSKQPLSPPPPRKVADAPTTTTTASAAATPEQNTQEMKTETKKTQ